MQNVVEFYYATVTPAGKSSTDQFTSDFIFPALSNILGFFLTNSISSGIIPFNLLLKSTKFLQLLNRL